MNINAALGVLAVALLTGCSSSPKKITITTHPAQAVVVILDDPGAQALVVAMESERIAKKLLKLVAPHLAKELLEKLEKMSVEELVSRLIAWVHLDRLPPATVAEVRASLGGLPGSLREQICSAVGLDDFGVSPMTMKRRTAKTYAVLAWAPGFKAEVKTLNPLKSPDSLSLSLAPK